MQKFNYDCAEWVVNQLGEHGYDATIREHYRGRGMRNTCTGIVTKAPATLIGTSVAEYNEEWDEDVSPPLRSDGMGLSTIYY